MAKGERGSRRFVARSPCATQEMCGDRQSEGQAHADTRQESICFSLHSVVRAHPPAQPAFVHALCAERGRFPIAPSRTWHRRFAGYTPSPEYPHSIRTIHAEDLHPHIAFILPRTSNDFNAFPYDFQWWLTQPRRFPACAQSIKTFAMNFPIMVN